MYSVHLKCQYNYDALELFNTIKGKKQVSKH